MVTITFDESSEAGRTLINVARALKQSVKNAKIHINEEKEEMTTAEKEEILDDIRDGLRKLKLVREGKLRSRPVEELLNEL